MALIWPSSFAVAELKDGLNVIMILYKLLNLINTILFIITQYKNKKSVPIMENRSEL